MLFEADGKQQTILESFGKNPEALLLYLKSERKKFLHFFSFSFPSKCLLIARCYGMIK